MKYGCLLTFSPLSFSQPSTTEYKVLHAMATPQNLPMNPRFTLELEFVSSLANPYYLSHLAVTYPHLLQISDDEQQSTTTTTSSSSEAKAFTSYLAYLYSYWKRPEYVQFLTHPGATLRALRLLQEERFRRDIIRPQVIEALAGDFFAGGEEGNDNDHDAMEE